MPNAERKVKSIRFAGSMARSTGFHSPCARRRVFASFFIRSEHFKKCQFHWESQSVRWTRAKQSETIATWKKAAPILLWLSADNNSSVCVPFIFFFSFLSCTERRKNLSHLAKVVISFTVPGYLASPRTFIGCVCALMQHMDSAFG